MTIVDERVRIMATVGGPWPETVSFERPKALLPFLEHVVRRSRSVDAVVLLGTAGFNMRYADLLAAVLLRITRRPPVVIISDATWQTGSARLSRGNRVLACALSRAARAVIRFIDGDNVTYAVLSTEEEAAFPERWGVDSGRVVFTPFSATLREAASLPVTDGGYFFAGGDSFRDYDLLMEAAALVPFEIRVATRLPLESKLGNVTIRQLDHWSYMKEFLASKAVVVPLRVAQRSAGQQTYINAMTAGKPLIVTEAPGVRDYVADGQTGLIARRDPEALAAAMTWIADPANQKALQEMTRRARDVAESEYSEEAYFRRLERIAVAAVERQRGRA